MIRILSLIDSGRLGWGYAVLGGFDLVLFILAEAVFATRYPQSYAEDWPTMSRALSDGSLPVFALLAAVAGLGLFLGAVGSGRMYLRRAREAGFAAGMLAVLACYWALSAALGVVLYFLVTVTLAINDHWHMVFSYTFFFGMTAVILCGTAGALLAGERLHSVPRNGPQPLAAALRRQIALGRAVAVSAMFFLAFFLMKDWELLDMATRDACRHIFVVTELAWIVLAHLYALAEMSLQLLHGRAHQQQTGNAGLARSGPITEVLT